MQNKHTVNRLHCFKDKVDAVHIGKAFSTLLPKDGLEIKTLLPNANAGGLQGLILVNIIRNTATYNLHKDLEKNSTLVHLSLSVLWASLLCYPE